jgi:hypothetical protein
MRIRINRPPSGTSPSKGTAAQWLAEAGNTEEEYYTKCEATVGSLGGSGQS